MKKLIYTIMYVFCIMGNVYAQLLLDYPFKVILDDSGFVYMTGEENGDIFAGKFGISGNNIWQKVYLKPGYDRGMDIIIDQNKNIVVTGFVTNQIDGLFDIAVLKFLNLNSSQILLNKSYGNLHFNDQAFGIVCDNDNYFYITGYEIDKNKKQNIKLLKCLGTNGNILKDTSYNNKEYNGDDVGTDILIDRGYLYILGYTYNGITNKNDIVQLTYDLEDESGNLVLEDALVVKSKANETPTSFIISDYASVPWQKSRTSMTVVTDNMGLPGSRDYLVITLQGSEIKWTRRFNGSGLDDVPVSVSAFDSKVYVSGYSFRDLKNSDFATLCYNLGDGTYGWGDSSVRYYDNGGGIDKGSSVKTVFQDDSLYVYIAGTSELSNNGFMIAKYHQTPEGITDPAWIRNYSPDISSLPVYREMQKASVIEVDSFYNVYQINYVWNETQKYYFIIKYNSDGDQIYVIHNTGETETSIMQKDIRKEFKLNNHPNPFNPSTKITYELKKPGFIELKIFDITGKEVEKLVSENQQTGTHSKEFHSGNLPSGVYFYSLFEDGIMLDVKKCMLVK